MLSGLRVAFLIAAIVLLLVLPFGEASVLIALFVAVDLAAAALLPRPAAPQPANIVPSGKDARTLALLRRTVPELRMRRPAATVEAQVRWRAAAEARRQFRVIS
ncbi:MAG TPA: hypothetical protein VFC56_02925 [Stellaceae bacterium]|nr:hypothetical protein [Stellaceae bacterium]